MDALRTERLEELLREYNRLGIGRQVGFERLHLYSIITHSTAIEGSTVTLAENTVMFDDGILPAGRNVREQMMNLDLKRAYEVAEELAVAKTRMTLTLLKALSSLVMRNTGLRYSTLNGEYDESKGDFRLQNASAGRGGRSYLAWEKVEERTAEFTIWLNDQLAHLDESAPATIYDLSFEADFRLVTIHPWSDGNGRTARLLMNLIQMSGGVVPCLVRSERKASYIEVLRESQEYGSSTPFLEFMADELLEVLAQEIDEYTRSLAQDVPWSSVSEEASNWVPTPQVTPQVTPRVKALVDALGTQELSARELRETLGLSDSKSFRERYLRPALESRVIEMTVPDKPRSSNQRYRLTSRGRAQ